MGKPSAKALGKRKAPGGPAGPAKKAAAGGFATDDVERADRGPTGKPKRRPDQPKKVKLRDQKVIPVPKTDFASDDEDDSDDDIMDMDLGEDEGLEIGNAGGFLAGLDAKALARTTKETKRIHANEKSRTSFPTKAKKAPSVASASDISDYDFDSEVEFSDDEELGAGYSDDDEDEEDGSGDEDEDDEDDDGDDISDISDLDDEDDGVDHPKRKKRADSEEAEYEMAGRSRWAEKEEEKEEDDMLEVGRLPIKLPTGEVQLVEGSTKFQKPQPKKPAQKPVVPESESESEDDASDVDAEAERMAAQPGRFGRMGVAEIVAAKGWKTAQRLAAVKEQMATIGAEVLGGGELIDVAPILTRLSTFSLPTVPNPDGEGTLPVPNSVRALGLLSLLAVYKDLIPGYRIRALTAAEESEKVRDEVRRMREGEKLLVRNYKTYLKALEAEVKGKTPLGSVALKCMSELLVSAPHFNFSENIMGVLVGRIGRRSWDDDSELILNSFVSVFRSDNTSTYSQALVRLIARMIKERKFQVHPNVLSCLLHLRLRTELSAMWEKKKGKGRDRKEQPEKKFKSEVRKQWQTKNQRKREKELKEIQKEMAEAEAEVDLEERQNTQTETLKNLFVLYFSILKFPGRSPLLPAGLEGISHFAHLINIDFFRDLLQVLRKIIADTQESEEDDVDIVGSHKRVRVRMLGIVTAFDLLSGQGEALNIDLGDFVNELFVLLRPLSLDTGIEDPPEMTQATAQAAAVQRNAGVKRASADRPPAHTLSTSALLFRCLEAIFFPRWFGASASAPPLRAAAFAKRLVECALYFPPATARESLHFVRRLATKETKLANLLDTEERMFDGVYRPEMDDPQLTNPYTTSLYELDVLAERHWEQKVKAEAKRLRDAQFV
ncbi:hypothetical protein VHUM_03764 [Vanrija humicola]|uniref:Nucleolar complex-associated protein 3 n=1 Tax=Vanrija humicola TaxID=5417 RepID=A0A7D8YXC4_VANHU|nr:hypothetical protein VHUM_03764 [Vanrija humicola]